MPPKKEKITSESTLQHLRRKPDNYIGVNAFVTEPSFVVQDGQIVKEKVEDFNEALIHPYKEVIDNAADNIAREWSTPQSYIKITVTKEYVEVTNDGKPIPVIKEEVELPNEITKKKETHTMYRTQALFNFFRTGTNATNDANDSKIGTNGIGMKAVLGVSSYAKIHHGDPDSGQQLTIEYKDGMTKIGEPKVKAYSGKKSFTTIHYVPDWKWYGLTEFSENHIGIMHALAKGLAYITGLKVTFNDEVIKIPNIKALGEAFFGSRQSMLLKTDTGDEVLVMEQSLEEMEAQGKEGYRHLSFVNKSYTRNGGIHVSYNANKIGKAMAEAFGAPLKPDDAKKFFIYIVNYTIKGDLKWSGQTKAALNATEKGNPLKRVNVEKKDMMKCKKWNVWNEITTFVEGKTNRDANKGVKGTSAYIGSLGKEGFDANYAGKKQKGKCVLYLTEGLSAKSLIDAGAKYRGGSDYVGVLALRGKISNVMKMADRSKQTDKKFLKLIRLMIGLKMGCKYLKEEEISTLRYGQICIAADKDHDGTHIRSILYSFFYQEHPGLLENGILSFLETPVIKTVLGKTVHRFFLKDDFDQWLKTLSDSQKNQAIKNRKFIKGLGGNNATDDSKFIFDTDYFVGQLTFKKQKDKDAIEVFFGKGKEKTKQKKDFMLTNFYGGKEHIHLPKSGTMTFSEFILHNFCPAIHEQILRAIPSCYDGLIESKRQILYVAFKHLKHLTKTVQFSTSVPTFSQYDHGEQNLAPTVIKMTQNIIGRNNIVVFKGDGIFGNRFQPPEDMNGAAAPRYTAVELQDIISVIFRAIDNDILEYEEKEGEISSPKYFLPIIPWFLVNGLSAPANTWSTTIPAYNPKDLVQWIRNWISVSFKDTPSFEEVKLVPWYRGFRGTIEESDNGFVSKGILTKIDDDCYHVDEIAANCWGIDLKEILEKLADEKLIDKPRILNEDTNTIRAEIQIKSKFNIEKALSSVLEHKFPTSNVTTIWDTRPMISTVDEHLEEYCKRRYRGYQDRRKFQITDLTHQLKIKEDKIRYIKMVLVGEINFKKIKDRAELIKILKGKGFTAFGEGEEDEVVVDDDKPSKQWGHITTMTLLTCTQKGIDRLEEEKEKVRERHRYYSENKPWKIWLDELDEFLVEYEKYLKDNPMNTIFEEWKPKGT